MHPSAIHSPLGNAETRGMASALPARVDRRRKRQNLAAAHNRNFKIIFSSNNSKLHCLQTGSVSFCAPTGIDPVGASQYPTVSCRRKRLHTPEGEAQMPNLNINGRNMSVEAANDTPLLWVIREQLQMTGTKFGCGAGLCGACTVHVNGEAVRSCQTSVSDAVGKKITTIEGLSRQGRSSAAEGLDRRAGSAMRLLPVRPDHAGGIAALQELQSDQG